MHIDNIVCVTFTENYIITHRARRALKLLHSFLANLQSCGRAWVRLKVCVCVCVCHVSVGGSGSQP